MNLIPHILWAVDAFTDEPEQESKLASLILNSLGERCTVEPVFVLRRGVVDTGAERFIESYPRIEDAAESALVQLVGRVALPGVGQPCVLESKDGTLSHAVETLTDYAAQCGADLIVANTHGRTGLNRLVLGSFCEELIEKSSVPLWLSNPHTALLVNPAHALFATDFSERSRAAFDAYLGWLKILGSKVTIFHLHEPDFAVPMARPQGFFPVPENWPRMQENEIRSLGQEWVNMARSAGVPAEFNTEIGAGDPAEEIIKAADLSGAGIIGMESHSGAVLAMLLGSATRQVLRKAHCSLFVYPKKAGAEHVRVAPVSYRNRVSTGV